MKSVPLDNTKLPLFTINSFDKKSIELEEQLHAKATTQDKSIKHLAHIYSLSGFVLFKNKLLKLTGNSSADSLVFISSLMNAFVSHCENSDKYKNFISNIQLVRNLTLRTMRYYYLINSDINIYPSSTLGEHDVVSAMLGDIKKSVFEIPTGWPKHAMELIVDKDNLYRINTGDCSTDAVIEHYRITKPEGISENFLERLYQCSKKERNKLYIQETIHRILGLEFLKSIPAEFQTVGNCTFQSLLAGLKVKYRLIFQEEKTADWIYTETIDFFKTFYLKEYLSQHPNSPSTDQILLRLITQKLLPTNQLENIEQLLNEYLSSDVSQEILYSELMIARWRLLFNYKSTEAFDSQMKSLNIDLNKKISKKLNLLNKILNKTLSQNELDNLSSDPIIQGYTFLHFAVANNDLSLIPTLIKKFPDTLNQFNWYNLPPIALARSVSMIKTLVDLGACIEGTEGTIALERAIILNRTDLVKTLLENRAPSNSNCMYLAGKKDPQIFQLLADFYPELVQEPNKSYKLFLHSAACSGLIKNMELAIQYGIKPNSKDINGETALQSALKNSRLDLAKKLIEYPGTLFQPPYRGDLVVNMTNNEDLRALMLSKNQERLSDVEYFEEFQEKLLTKKIKKNVDHLIYAIRINDIKAIRGCLVLNPELKVTSLSKLYQTSPLLEAITQSIGKQGESYELAIKVVEMLLKTPGVNINSLSSKSKPLIFSIVESGDLNLLNLVLSYEKLNLNLKDNEGYTALERAIMNNNLDLVERLLKDSRIEYPIISDKKFS